MLYVLLFTFFALLCYCADQKEFELDSLSCSSKSTNLASSSTKSSASTVPLQMASYIEAEDLANLILNGSEKLLVVDVRDDDYDTAKVIDSVHYPFKNLLSEMDELVNRAIQYDKVVFHCHFSAVRGPKSAALFKRAYLKRFEDGKLEILVLSGGFERWYGEYSADPRLCSDL